jgi:nucleoid-associated protein YgaU
VEEAPPPAVVKPEPPPPAPEPDGYLVLRSDSLTRIAEKVYGDGSKWVLIYEANRDKLPRPNNPHLIHPDTVLVIPVLEAEFDGVDAE